MKFDISEIGEIHCTRISGVKGTSHFIELGNIRVLDHSIDICKKPTPQQIKVLWEVLDSYYGDVLYLDLLNKNIGNFSQQYQSCNPERVMNDIISYFNNKKRVFETVKYLLNKELKENMKKNAVKINENTLRQIVAESVEKVLKEYEDRSFNSSEFYGEALDTAVQTYLDSLNIEPRYFVTDTEKIGKAFGDKLFEIANQNGNEYRKKLDAARINSTDYHGEGYGGYPY